jgi:hypothetical protein
MANSKNLSREMRKGVKRSQRKGLKAIWAELKSKDRRKFRNMEEQVGLKAYANSLEAPSEEA